MTAIISNGQVLVAHHHEGETPYLVVTFMGFFHEGEAESRYLLREVLESEGVACVGVTSRLRNLFVSPEIEDVAAAVRARRRPGQKVIMLGQSSGGYAAVKFARLFEADAVLSVSPVFSADITDLELTPDMGQHIGFLRDAIRLHRIPAEVIRPGMRPGPEDCPVPLLIVYDIRNEYDTYAADLFRRMFPAAATVQVTNLGHAVLDEIGDHDTLLPLLGLLAADDLDGARNLLRRLTRNSEAAIAELMVRIARWRPSALPRALATERARNYLGEDARRRHPFNTVLAYEQVRRNETEAARAWLRPHHPDLFPPSTGASGLFIVLSWHGDMLTFDVDRSEVVLTHDFASRGRTPALLDMTGAAPRLVIRLRGDLVPVLLDEAGVAAAGENFAVVEERTGIAAFRRGDFFLRGNRDSVPVFAASAVNDWERFALLPAPAPTQAAASGGLNWLDQTVVAVRTADAGQAPLPAPVDRARRKAAFRSLLRFFTN